VYAGVQLLHPRLFKTCPAGAFSLNILYDRAMQTTPPRIKALIHDGAWLHVGDVSGKDQAEAYLLANC
jgi:MurNAc alpha-1-phosphate uridylyltransferase